MGKKKIYFLAPRNEGGTYFYYKEISEYLIKNNSDILDVKFCNSLSDYIKLHFIKSDIIFSIIPFLFKPLFSKKYIFNLHGDFEIERKNKGLGIKLLYLSELNLWFSDKIMLTSYYLADKLNFRKKYNNKIIIIPNFIKKISGGTKKIDKNNINLLTISSSTFYKKGIGVYELAKEIFKIDNIKISWNIIFPGNENNKEDVLKKIYNLKKNENINFKIYDFIEKRDLGNIYIKSDIYVYSSNLESWGGTILDACSFGKPVILLKNSLWEYIYPKDFVTNNFENSILEIINNYDLKSKESYNFCGKFLLRDVADNLLKNEILNNNPNI